MLRHGDEERSRARGWICRCGSRTAATTIDIQEGEMVSDDVEEDRVTGGPFVRELRGRPKKRQPGGHHAENPKFDCIQ